MRRLARGLTTATAVLAVVAGLSLPDTAPSQQRRRALNWRVEGGAEALEPTVRVRLIMRNGIPTAAASERFGLVQTAMYLFAPGGDGEPFGAFAARPGLAVEVLDRELLAAGAKDDIRVTVQPQGLAEEQYHTGLVVGRAVKVHGVSMADNGSTLTRDEAVTLAATALRADQDDLEERRRWAADTLILPGREKLVWEGSLPLDVDRIYADYLVARAPSSAVRQPNNNVEGADSMLNPEGGILAIAPTAPGIPLVPGPVSTGLTVARPAGERIFPLTLVRGELNIIRVSAVVDPTGTFLLELTTEVESEPGEDAP